MCSSALRLWIATGLDTEPDDQDNARAVLEQMPQLAPIDTAMRGTLGFGIDALAGVLSIAAQWKADAGASATLAAAQDVVTQCVEFAVGAVREEYEAAVDWLTLRADDLQADVIPHWETERRDKRIATRPFVASDDGLWILPWTAEHAQRIIAVYLSDGRLPWPARTLPNEVNKAL
ncbi:MAG: hypothetical protein HOV94_44445 [Saccharothrix sp.]|nr:hypothetical protein [Saccharothrix sp.]